MDGKYVTWISSILNLTTLAALSITEPGQWIFLNTVIQAGTKPIWVGMWEKSQDPHQTAHVKELERDLRLEHRKSSWCSQNNPGFLILQCSIPYRFAFSCNRIGLWK